ncbi:MAG: hypothetical protein C0609_00670 [Deltaproteobacteria bacterium]|nr:MAG: hypothetical protein C0609_00670 [Deltaproteobacteria bacterium]
MNSQLTPAAVVIDRGVAEAPFTRSLLSRLPKNIPVTIREDGSPTPKGKRTLFITREQGSFLKKCPCSPGVVECGYYVFTLGFQCPFACSYCFLRFYAPDEPLTLYANLEDAALEFRAAAKGWKRRIRVGTGEFTDSLALDHLTQHSAYLSELVRPLPNVLMEVKTKSGNVEALLAADPPKNLIAAWSVNPPSFMANDEGGTATLDERLRAAGRYAEAGRKVAFHFDPVVMVEGWREKYLAVIAGIFDAVKPEAVAWISVGTLRFPKRFIEEWGAKLSGNPLFFDEFVPSPDGKLRYFWPRRREIYRFFASGIKELGGKEVPLYLCMESNEMYSSAFGWPVSEGDVENFLTGMARGPLLPYD